MYHILWKDAAGEPEATPDGDLVDEFEEAAIKAYGGMTLGGERGGGEERHRQLRTRGRGDHKGG